MTSNMPKHSKLPPRPRRAALPRLAALGAVLALAGAPLDAVAGAAEDKGLAIAKETDRRDLGWGDSLVSAKMVLKNKQGQTSDRWMKLKSLEGKTDGDKSIIVFTRPFDIDGTALLTFTHKKGDDDQWLFLPALKRVKRISSSNKSGSFVGSEFAYEDLTSQEVEKYTYKYLRDEACGALKCFVTERYPVDENSGYTRQIVWTDKAEYRVLKIMYYDRKNAHLKTLVFKSYKKYLGQYWPRYFL